MTVFDGERTLVGRSCAVYFVILVRITPLINLRHFMFIETVTKYA